MKELGKKMFGWLQVSNRKKHMMVGWIITIAFLIIYGILAALFGIDVDSAEAGKFAVIAALLDVLCVALCMCSIEYIQKQQGGKWDWLDIAAGIIPVILVFFVVMFVALL